MKNSPYTETVLIEQNKVCRRHTYSLTALLLAALLLALLVGLSVTTVLTEAAVGEGDDFDPDEFER